MLIPDAVANVNGQQFACDARLVDALRMAAKRLGFSPASGRLLTAPHIVTGTEREVWSERGFVAADMEAGLLAESGVAFATIRVILDSPSRSMSDAWEQPARAMLRPGRWRELGWLATAAPRYALRAARLGSVAIGQIG